MEQQPESLPYRQQFVRHCFELAIVQLAGYRITLTSIESAELENFIRMALVDKTDVYLSEQEHLYRERLLLLMDLSSTRLRISNQPIGFILESLLPWYPWY